MINVVYRKNLKSSKSKSLVISHQRNRCEASFQMRQYDVTEKERHCSASTLIKFAATIEVQRK